MIQPSMKIQLPLCSLFKESFMSLLNLKNVIAFAQIYPTTCLYKWENKLIPLQSLLVLLILLVSLLLHCFTFFTAEIPSKFGILA